MRTEERKGGTAQLSIIVAGDIMTHGNQIRSAYNPDSGKYDFEDYFQYTGALIRSADLAICNLETTLAGGEVYSGFPKFNTPDAMADAVANAGFRVVATANNHAYDSGCQGIIRTREVLESRGLTVAGTRKTADEEACAVTEVEGLQVAVLNYTYETAKMGGRKTLNNRPLDDCAAKLVNSFSFETLEEDLKRIEEDVRRARAQGAQLLLVYYHWGNEYERYSNVLQKFIAYRTACMGVDAIIGSHAHVLQELRELSVSVSGKEKRVPVFFGLGNYIWGVSAIPGRETVCHGALARLRVTYDMAEKSVLEISPDYIPLYIDIRSQETRTAFRVLPLLEDGSVEQCLKIREEIDRTLNNQIHDAPVDMRFDHILEIPAGTKRSVFAELATGETYSVFRSEDAIIASALQNGEIVGNSPGYTGITAVSAGGVETVLMVRVTGKGSSQIPVIVNENNSIRDIFLPEQRVKGPSYELPDDVSLCRNAANAWKVMRAAARQEGICLSCVTGFRSKKVQLIRINRYADRFGMALAVKRYMPVGCSEHHLGTSLDIAGGEMGGGKRTTTVQAIRWVQDNAHKFGFLARKGKSSIDKMAYVHVRFLEDWEEVQFLRENGLTLEEYLQRYEDFQQKRKESDAWKYRTKKLSKNKKSRQRELTLRLICQIVGVRVPKEFAEIQDRVIPQVTLSDINVMKGSVFFYDKMLSKEMQKCRNALRSGAVLAFAEQQICDECGNPMPTIVVEDSLAACVKVGKYIRELYPAKTVCVTGSAGKTTTQELTYLVLSSKFNTHTCYNNANNRVNILRLIQQLKPEHQMYVQEVGGSFPKHIEKSAEMLLPDVAIITNIGDAHLDLYKTFDNIIEDKLSLLKSLKPQGMALLNIDNVILKDHVEHGSSGQHIVTYGIENLEADYSALDIVQEVDGLQLTIVEKQTERQIPVKVDIIGKHNAYNIIAAYAVGRWAGMTEEEILCGLSRYHAKGIRQALRNVGGYHLYIDCFSSVEISLISSLRTLSEMKCEPGRRKIAVVWELMRLGDKRDEICQRVGAAVRNLNIDLILVMGADGLPMVKEMEKGRVNVRHTTDWNEMNRWILDLSRPGDILLFKGQHMQSIVLSMDYVFGTDYYINNVFERRTAATPFKSDHWEGVIINKEVAVIDRRTGNADSVQIPDRIGQMPVVYLNRKLYANSALRSIVIGDQVVGIGAEAFTNCQQLMEVEFGRNVRHIDREAFCNCVSLREVILPRGCMHIAERAFADCSSLARVVIPRSVGYIADNAFENCPEVVVVYEQELVEGDMNR